MSAREELDAAMKRGTFLAHERGRLIDAYAHELAERQRHKADDMRRRGLVPEVRYLVNLIDPEVNGA